LFVFKNIIIFMNVNYSGHQDHLNVLNDSMLYGYRTEAEMTLYEIVKGDSNLDLSEKMVKKRKKMQETQMSRQTQTKRQKGMSRKDVDQE